MLFLKSFVFVGPECHHLFVLAPILAVAQTKAHEIKPVHISIDILLKIDAQTQRSRIWNGTREEQEKKWKRR